jgi:hypothetical protein
MILALFLQITVGQNILVSRERPELVHDESRLVVNPKNPNQLLGCSIANGKTDRNIGMAAYLSNDAGATWKLVYQDSTTNGDDDCMFGLDGSLYVGGIRNDGKEKNPLARFEIRQSADGGKTWTLINRIPDVPDRATLALDATGGKHNGWMYLPFNGNMRGIDSRSGAPLMAIERSKDGGKTFDRRIARAVLDRPAVFWLSNGAVLEDGTFIVVYLRRDLGERNSGQVLKPWTPGNPNAAMWSVTTSDGGETMDAPVLIGDMYADTRMSSGNMLSQPALAVDQGNGPFKGRVYATWTDVREGRKRVYVAYTSDKGKTWSTPHPIDDSKPFTNGKGPDIIVPVVAVNTDGVVAVSWYDRRENPDNVGYYTRITASLDGGDTWMPSTRVATGAHLHEFDRALEFSAHAFQRGNEGIGVNVSSSASFDLSSGHTQGMAADAAGVFHPFWIDNRTGTSQIWTAPVTVRGTVLKHGSAELAGLVEITKSVTLEIGPATFDKRSSTMIFPARIKNTSKDTIRGPVYVRALRLESEISTPTVVGSENGKNGSGAVWNFTSSLPGGMLLPDSSGSFKELRFRLADLKGFKQGEEFKFEMVSFTAQVFGLAKEK